MLRVVRFQQNPNSNDHPWRDFPSSSWPFRQAFWFGLCFEARQTRVNPEVGSPRLSCLERGAHSDPWFQELTHVPTIPGSAWHLNSTGSRQTQRYVEVGASLQLVTLDMTNHGLQFTLSVAQRLQPVFIPLSRVVVAARNVDGSGRLASE